MATHRAIPSSPHNDFNTLGIILHEMGEYEDAIDAFRRASDLASGLPPLHHLRIRIRNNLAGTLRRGDIDYGEALKLYTAALRDAETIGNPLLIASVLNNLAVNYESLANKSAAIPHFERALALRDSFLGPNAAYTVGTKGNLARLLYPRSRADTTGLARAEALLEECVSAAPSLTEEAGANLHPSTIELLFRRLAAVKLRRDPKLNARRAWDLNESALYRPLYDISLRSARLSGARSGAKAFDETGSELIAAQRRHRRSMSAESRQALDAAERRWLNQQLATREREGSFAIHPVSLEELQRVLQSDEVVVGWMDVEWGTHSWFPRQENWAYVVRSSGPPTWIQLTGKTERSSRQNVDLRRALESPNSPVEDVRAMTEAYLRERFEPVRAAVADVATIHVVNEVGGDVLPIEAALAAIGDAATAQFRYHDSSTSLWWHRTHDESDVGAKIAITDPTPNPTVCRSCLPLPAQREVGLRFVAADSGAEHLTGVQATEANLSSRFTGQNVLLHFGCHIITDEKETGIVLAPDPENDGLLTPAEISQWRMSGTVVLAGCESAYQRRASGFMPQDLVTAFTLAGARRIVASLWRVEDQPTALFLRRFYAELDSGTDVPTSVSRARRFVREYRDGSGEEPYVHPSYWASFIAFGE